jgi:histidinol-phosphatase (PHP family)
MAKHIKWDGHTHTHFCKHGSDATGADYVERAITLGFDRISVTEHPPLPVGWLKDKKVIDELAMSMSELTAYLDYVWACKQRYATEIDLAPGLELDFLPEAEGFTSELLGMCEGRFEDLIVSVHFLPGADGMRCVDLSPTDFEEGLLSHYGSIQKVAETYFDHVEAAIRYAAKLPGRKRIGHIQLIEKFRKELPSLDEAWATERLRSLIPLLAQCGVGVDVNTAGLRKDTCRLPYVPDWFIRECAGAKIECVYGSDAHKPEEVGADWNWFDRVNRSIPV